MNRNVNKLPNGDFEVENEKQEARRLYKSLPHGRKIPFCQELADKYGLSEKYILKEWFNSTERYRGVPNKYISEVLKLLKSEHYE